MRRREWQTLALSLALLAPVPALAAAEPASTAQSNEQNSDRVTAQDLFDEVIYELALNYNGTSPLRAQDLRERFLPRAEALCAGRSVCDSKLAYPLIGQVLRELHDEHTNFFSPQEWNSINLASAGEVDQASFGVVVRTVLGQGVLVTEVIPGSPAALAGLQPGDLLTRLDRLPLRGLWGEDKLAAAGRSGREVKLTYTRAGRPGQAELAGRPFVTPPVSLDLLDDHTALIRLRNFDRDGVAQDLHNALRRAQQQGATRAVLDLRGNPGGYVTETLLSTGALTDPAPLRKVERSSSQTLSYQQGRYLVDGQPQRGQRVFKPQRFSGPLAVLIDGDSASGAEFMARDLLTRPQTVVLGRPTAGLADTSTIVLDLADGSGLQVTTAKMQSVLGQPLGARVQPQVPLQRDDRAFIRTGQDPELQAALRALNRLGL
ncbi:S41 family peptidase [Deinococcus sp. Marseille-Q6407]|uniref:S41 family peptidase n=1 Tax=Deinococcus sp. Marseille-Q6407 TaxID=2969223 RepID=UPI0021BEEB7E|nr:S41 family peptidase [Deinococcus sp. Marseille-Q6407]